MSDLRDLAKRLRYYGEARDRAVDKESRSVVITDDEAMLLAEALDLLLERS